MSYAEAMSALEAKGSEQTRETYRRHGAPDPMFGVKFGDLRPLAKKNGAGQGLAAPPATPSPGSGSATTGS